MKIANAGLLHSYGLQNAQVKKWIENWISDVKSASWKTSHDVKARYPSVSFLGEKLVIFNVCGNKYRLEARIAYNSGAIYIEWIGTHEEYMRRNNKRQ